MGGGALPSLGCPRSAYFLALLSRLSMSLKALVQGKRGAKDKEGISPPLEPSFASHLLNKVQFAKMKNSLQASKYLLAVFSEIRQALRPFTRL